MRIPNLSRTSSLLLLPCALLIFGCGDSLGDASGQSAVVDRKRDDEAWRKAEASPDQGAFAAYAKAFPKGRHKVDALRIDAFVAGLRGDLLAFVNRETCDLESIATLGSGGEELQRRVIPAGGVRIDSDGKPKRRTRAWMVINSPDGRISIQGPVGAASRLSDIDKLTIERGARVISNTGDYYFDGLKWRLLSAEAATILELDQLKMAELRRQIEALRRSNEGHAVQSRAANEVAKEATQRAEQLAARIAKLETELRAIKGR